MRARFAPLASPMAAAPLCAAGWAVGARYYYLPSVGLCWAVAEALADVAPRRGSPSAAVLLWSGAAQAVERRRRSSPTSSGWRRRGARWRLGSAPDTTSFTSMAKSRISTWRSRRSRPRGGRRPGARRRAGVVRDRAAPVSGGVACVAAPPLPPSGALSLRRRPVVGLARRGDEPDLDEALAQFPDLRFIRLRAIRGGQVIARDLTDEIKLRLDAAAPTGKIERPPWNPQSAMSLSRPAGLVAGRRRQRDAVAGGRARGVGRAAPVSGLRRLWLAAWPEEVEGGMILCSPEPLRRGGSRRSTRAATLRAYCLARLEEHLGRCASGSSTAARPAASATAGRANYCLEHLIADRFGRHLARLEALPRANRQG